jgi:hypothetical protein
MKLVFSRLVFETPPPPPFPKYKFMQIRQVGAELFHVDRWTDKLPNLIVAFRKSANVQNKNESNGHMDLFFLSPPSRLELPVPLSPSTTESSQ